MSADVHPDRSVYWCHECKAWQPSIHEPLGGIEYECGTCGETILCDECGQPWSDDHECSRGIE